MIKVLLFIVFVALAVAGVIAVSLSPAPAHEAPSGMKYDAECCSNKDCAPVRTMERTPEGGWRITNENGHTAEFGPLFKIRMSTDGKAHACITPTAQVPLCLYLAPGV